ncbi:MAG: tRNA (guanosine(46)-N7)-methyltransferase TrmB [Rikenellaceae bacterium]|nr:tRNA (guanosine(46)-N7)-methyltransferase TrmB [Rikenellaceae bacterium]
MGKNKFKRFRENETFQCLLQPEFGEIFNKDHRIKGNWRQDFFKNQNPLCLELGCGRGEYTVGLGERNPGINYIGVDIKGARMWRGAKTATENKMPNVEFLRTRIEFINSFFDEKEVDEIWITFPDPQLKKGREKKRLTSAAFLEMYSKFLKPEGIIHLKTDCLPLHDYTKQVIETNELEIIEENTDIYGTGFADEILSVKTTYEEYYLKLGIPITYVSFRLNGKKAFTAPEIPE